MNLRNILYVYKFLLLLSKLSAVKSKTTSYIFSSYVVALTLILEYTR